MTFRRTELLTCNHCNSKREPVAPQLRTYSGVRKRRGRTTVEEALELLKKQLAAVHRQSRDHLHIVREQPHPTFRHLFGQRECLDEDVVFTTVPLRNR
jgi:hypothetical protein